MANGLLDPVYRILPSKVDAKRRSWDPAGLIGVTVFTPGHLTITGKAVTLRKVRPILAGHLAITGRLTVVNKVRPILPGHLQTTGQSINTKSVRWLTIPRFDVNWGAVSYPHVIPGSVGIRANYLIDANATVQTVTLGGIDLPQISYDTPNDRIIIASNPGVDTIDSVYMVADGLASNTFQIALVNPISFPIYLAEDKSGGQNPNVFDSVPTLVLHAGDYYGQVGPLSDPAAAVLTLGDNGYMKSDFTLFTLSTLAAPSLIGSMRASANSQTTTANISSLAGLAPGQGLLLLWTGVGGPLAPATDPGTQGWTLIGVSNQTSGPDMSVWWKLATGAEPSLVLTQTGGGRQGAFITNWSNVNSTVFGDQVAQFLQSLDTDPVRYKTPSITPTEDYCTIISFDADGSFPLYSSPTSSPPTGHTLIDQFIVATVHWLGASYRKQTTKAATGVLTWTLTTAAGGPKLGATLALRGTKAVSEYRGYTVPMRHHTSTGPGEDGFGNTFWTLQVLPPAAP